MSSIPSFRINNTQFASAIDELKKYVEIPSVSNPESPDYSKDNLEMAAQFASTRLKDLAFDVTECRIEDSAPFIIAQKIVDISKPTILLYAHYDVQPVESNQWASPPFSMEERQGRLYGRGVSDDKGGIIAILTVLKAYKENNLQLPVNVKILFEGEEEYGSAHIKQLLEQNAAALHANALVILDGMNQHAKTGTLSTSTRGLVSLSVEVKALKKPVHSGLGCLAPDPSMGLAILISSLRHPKNIPGFMDDYRTLSELERMKLKQSSPSAESYAQENGVHKNAVLRGDPQKSIFERIAEEPSLSVLNMQAGRPGGGNSIQDAARCEIGIRTTAGQDPDRIARVVKNYLQSQSTAIGGLKIRVEQMEPGNRAWSSDISKSYATKYLNALREIFPKTAVQPGPGTLPMLADFEAIFPETEIILPGVLDPESCPHSHNESQDKELLRNSIDALINFFAKASEG